MKAIINLLSVFVLVFTSSLALNAQEHKAENEGWIVNLEEAQKISEQTGKPILANFTGSDWCGWCKKLTRDVFVKEEFKKWADKNVVLLELDYPRRKSLPADLKAQNAKLQQAFSIRGYPSVWLFDVNIDDTGNYDIGSWGKSGYAKTPTEFISAFTPHLKRRKAKKG